LSGRIETTVKTIPRRKAYPGVSFPDGSALKRLLDDYPQQPFVNLLTIEESQQF